MLSTPAGSPDTLSPSPVDKELLLNQVAAEISVCRLCPLCESRTMAVPGDGKVGARIMFVGEGPGEKEDLSGHPFVGAAGNLLTRLLERAGLSRQDVFITNIVKCRPPGNRVPTPEEITTCNDYLMAQIALVEPKIICPLGGPSTKTLVHPDLAISHSRCKVFRKNGILFIPLYHPAAALHRGSLLETLQQDILVLKDLINREISESEITDLTPPPVRVERICIGPEVQPGPASQPSLFE